MGRGDDRHRRCVKIVPALLMGYLLLRRRWRALAVSMVVTIALLVASLALVGWDSFYGLVPLLLTAGIGQDTLAHNNPCSAHS